MGLVGLVREWGVKGLGPISSNSIIDKYKKMCKVGYIEVLGAKLLGLVQW